MLDSEEQRALRVIAGHMIPASEAYAVPGADDDVIFADIVSSLERDTQAVRQALAAVADAAGCAIADLSAERRLVVLNEFRAAHRALASALELVIAQCYYRDDRVMRSIGMEPRPPFPKGFMLESGDLTLLDPVRARGKKYREVS